MKGEERLGTRVNLVGVSGSGKSTVGQELARKLGVPYVEVDALNHGPNWTEATPEELRAKVEATMDAGAGWVLDGNYEHKLGDAILSRADTLVWLDLPLRTVLARLLRRTRTRIRDHVELWNGNKESWRTALVGRESLFVWAIRRHFHHRRNLPSRLARHPNLTVVRLRSPREVSRWLESIDSR